MKGSLGKVLLVAALLLTSGCAQVLDNLQDTVGGQQGAGSAYEQYLTGDRRLVVELDHSPGALWDSSTDVDNDFRRQVERITDKNVEIRTTAELPNKGSDYAWSASELRELHREHQDLSTDQSKVVMHALFVDGDFEKPDTVGLAYDADAFAMFMGKIDENSCSNNAVVCNGAKQWKVVRAVSIHEAGHLFGLVNSPLPMVNDHEDPDHRAHSTNKDSVMFWKVESSRGLSDLIGGGDVPWQFDRNDLRDANNQRSGQG